jgi:hypothetical protein
MSPISTAKEGYDGRMNSVSHNAAELPRVRVAQQGGAADMAGADNRVLQAAVDYVASHGDGISFQQSHDVQVVRCEVSGCAQLGIHPGSGSQRPTVLDCFSHDNGTIGLFLFAGGGADVHVGGETRGVVFERCRIDGAITTGPDAEPPTVIEPVRAREPVIAGR